MEGEDLLDLLSEYGSLQDCPVALGFRLLGKRWTIEVLRQMFLGDSRFNDFIRHAPGMGPRILSIRLKELEDCGLVTRSVSSGTPVLTEYTLTEVGRDVISVMFEMATFTMKNFPEKVFLDGVPRTPQQFVEEVRLSRTNRPVSAEHLSAF